MWIHEFGGRVTYMPASTWAQLLGNRRTGCKSTGIRRWVSRVECTCEHQSKFDGRCTVCLRDGPRLLFLPVALCQSSTTVQPTQKPPRRIPASTIQDVIRNRNDLEFVGHRRAPTYFWFSRLPEQEYCAINFLLVAHSQATGELCRKGITSRIYC